MNQFDEKLKAAAEKYRLKVLAEVTEGKRANSYSALRQLESGEQTDRKSFTLPNHAEEDLSPDQSAERLADYFSKISQDFDPINPQNFPPWIKQKLSDGKSDSQKPVLEEWQVYEKLTNSKKPSSIVGIYLLS